MNPLLKVSDLHVHFQTPSGLVKANNGVNLEVAGGDAIGIMGESGCGKTVLFLSLLRLQQPGNIVRGSVEFDGQNLVKLSEKSMRRIRGRQIGLVPQNQATALNPGYTVEQHLDEVLRIREGNVNLLSHLGKAGTLSKAHRIEAEAMLSELGLGDAQRIHSLLHSYPHQLSGGMRQRILTAMALLLKPRLLIADEPTTALDRATRQRSMELLKDIKQRSTLMLVSHDIEVIDAVCTRVAVMYGGRVIESGLTSHVLSKPLHPYTKILLACHQVSRERALPDIAIDTQDLINLPTGCPFRPFCPQVMPVCAEQPPAEYAVGPVTVACHRFKNEVAHA